MVWRRTRRSTFLTATKPLNSFVSPSASRITSSSAIRPPAVWRINRSLALLSSTGRRARTGAAPARPLDFAPLRGEPHLGGLAYESSEICSICRRGRGRGRPGRHGPGGDRPGPGAGAAQDRRHGRLLRCLWRPHRRRGRGHADGHRGCRRQGARPPGRDPVGRPPDQARHRRPDRAPLVRRRRRQDDHRPRHLVGGAGRAQDHARKRA